MKNLLTHLIVAIGLFVPSATFAQDFNGFEINGKYGDAERTCRKAGGVWLPTVNEADIINGGYCFHDKQIVTEKKGAYVLEQARQTAFVYNVDTGKLQLVMFEYSFPTWAMRDHARKSLMHSLSELFPLTVTKVAPYEYKLNNLKYYFVLDTAESGGKFWLGVIFVDEETYQQTKEQEVKASK